VWKYDLGDSFKRGKAYENDEKSAKGTAGKIGWLSKWAIKKILLSQSAFFGTKNRQIWRFMDADANLLSELLEKDFPELDPDLRKRNFRRYFTPISCTPIPFGDIEWEKGRS